MESDHDGQIVHGRALHGRAIHGRALRHLLTVILQEQGPTNVSGLVEAVARDGFVLDGRASKVVSDALRWEIGHGRVVKLGRGLYGPGTMPRSTRYWIRAQVREARLRAHLPV